MPRTPSFGGGTSNITMSLEWSARTPRHVATMHRLSPALNQGPDLLLVIRHLQLSPFDGTAPGAFGWHLRTIHVSETAPHLASHRWRRSWSLARRLDHIGRSERPQHCRHADRSVFLLMVLHQGDDRPAHRHGRAVQGVEVPRSFALRGPVADVKAAGLEVGGVRTRGQLAVAALAGKPRLQVVLLRRRCPKVVHGDVHDAVRDLERLHQLLLDREQPLVLGRRLLRNDEGEHLDLVELVDAKDAARVLARGSGLAAEAGREAGVTPR